MDVHKECIEKNRLLWIDSLKGIAICAVVMIHANGAIVDSPLKYFAQSGWSGVQIFLILSAFLTLRQLEKKSSERGGFSSWNWLLHRMMKLIPMYYCTLLIGIVFFRNQNIWLGSNMKLTMPNIIFHLLFLHTLVPYYANSILWVEWYLGDFFLFSLITCLFYKKNDNLKKSIFILLLGIAISAAVHKLMNSIMLLPEIDEYIWIGYRETYSPIKQFPVWALGGVLFYAIKEDRLFAFLQKNKIIRSGLLFSTLFFISGLIIAHSNNVLLFAIAYMVLIYIMSCVRIQFLDNKIWRYIGRKSYGIYLCHYLLILMFEKISIFKDTTDTGIWLVKYILVLGTALLMTLLWEWIMQKMRGGAERRKWIIEKRM